LRLQLVLRQLWLWPSLPLVPLPSPLLRIELLRVELWLRKELRLRCCPQLRLQCRSELWLRIELRMQFVLRQLRLWPPLPPVRLVALLPSLMLR
jgi:hypothetical protein